MNKIIKKLLLLLIVFFLISNIKVNSIECELDANPYGKSQEELNELINKCTSKRNELSQRRNSLSSEIQYMDTQIYLTTLKIQETEQKKVTTENEINILESRIDGLDQSLDYISKLLLNKIVQSYKQRQISLFSLLFDSQNIDELMTKIKYIKTTRNNNQKLLIQIQEAKYNFEEQKKMREEKKIELDQLNLTLNSQKQALASQKTQKQKLLADTQNDEATYQRLLSQAKELLASFSRFVQNQGGASLLNNQTRCDDWGCYFNQRDSQWGANSLNGTAYTLASDGCLVTSMAMVYTHLGKRNVTPQTINSNPNNFASYYPAHLQYTITADGLTTSRILSTIDSTLSSGEPVVVGINAYGGTHFVVLINGSNGNYTMHDPYIENGSRISFNDYYSVNNIFEIRKVIIQ